MAKPRGEGDHARPFAHLALAVQVQARGHHRAVLREPQAVKPAGGHLCDAGPLRRPGPAVGVVAQVGHGAVAVEDQTVVPAQGPVPGVHDRLGGVGGAQGVPHQLHPSAGQLHPTEGPADHRVRPRELARQTLVAPVPRQQGSLPQGQGVPGAGPQFVPIYIAHLLGHLPPAVFQLLPEGGPGVRVLHLFRKGQGVRKAQPLQRGPGLRRQGLVPGRFPLRFDLGDQLRLKTGLLQQGQRLLQPSLRPGLQGLLQQGLPPPGLGLRRGLRFRRPTGLLLRLKQLTPGPVRKGRQLRRKAGGHGRVRGQGENVGDGPLRRQKRRPLRGVQQGGPAGKDPCRPPNHEGPVPAEEAEGGPLQQLPIGGHGRPIVFLFQQAVGLGLQPLQAALRPIQEEPGRRQGQEKG